MASLPMGTKIPAPLPQTYTFIFYGLLHLLQSYTGVVQRGIKGAASPSKNSALSPSVAPNEVYDKV